MDLCLKEFSAVWVSLLLGVVIIDHSTPACVLEPYPPITETIYGDPPSLGSNYLDHTTLTTLLASGKFPIMTHLSPPIDPIITSIFHFLSVLS